MTPPASTAAAPPPHALPADPLLEIRDLTVHYGVIAALRGISLSIPAGAIVTLIGANGAGKTTTLRTISGLIPARRGAILFAGRNIVGQRPDQIVALGISQVPEGRLIFANLTVLENLRMGAFRQPRRALIADDLDRVYQLFPRLRERPSQIAGTLSGGEQQMLAIGRALMSRPRLLMLDEPSLGLAPLLVAAIFEKIAAINRDQKTTIILVEQNANLALEISDFGYVLETGRVILAGRSADLRRNPQIRQAYLGVS